MQVKPQVLTLRAYVPGKPAEAVKKEYALDKVVKLASNENPFGCSPTVMEAIAKLATEFATYPDGVAEALRDQVANALQVSPNQLLFGSGADEVIQYISRGLLSQGDNIVQAEITFSQYEHHAVIEGAEVRKVPMKNGVHDLDGMLEKIDDSTKIVWVCNPNNPTGTYVNEEELARFVKAVPSHVLVVIDEAYVEYVEASDFPNSLQYLKEFKNVMVLRTFSKAYGLAAFRIGYGIGHEELISKLNIVRLPFNTSMLAQVAAMSALEDQDFIAYCVKENRKGLQQYVAFCEENNLGYYPSQANFVYISLPNSMNLFEDLQAKGYIVRAFPQGIRITIGTTEDNEGLLKELKELL